jgi:hypothetical protein
VQVWLAQGPHDADDETQDVAVAFAAAAAAAAAAAVEHVIADQALQRGVPRQRPGVEQHGRRRLGQRPARQARSQPRDRPEEERQEALRARNSADRVSRLA